MSPETTLECPLCGSTVPNLLEKVSVSGLVSLYKDILGVAVSDEFSGGRELIYYSCSLCDLRFFHPLLTGSEGFYESLQKLDWYYLSDKEEYDFARRFVGQESKVLEVGCGRGAFAKKIPTSDYTGLEFSSKARDMGAKEGVKILNETVQEHAARAQERYDVVCSFQVLEHVSDVKGFLAGSLKCLKPGGLYIIAVPSEDSFVSTVTNSALNMPPHHVTRWTDKGLRSIAEIFKLQIVELRHEDLSDIHREWYRATMVLNRLNRALKRRQRLLDISLFGKVLAKVAHIIATHTALFANGAGVRPRGHSVVAVYRKPSVQALS